MPTKSIETLNQTYNAWRVRFGWGEDALRTVPQHDGTEHIELIENIWHLVVTERGLELSRKIFSTDEALLEQMFLDLTFWAGVSYEFNNRVEHLDCRRMIFAHQLALLQPVNLEWYQAAQRRISETLDKHPYIDSGVPPDTATKYRSSI